MAKQSVTAPMNGKHRKPLDRAKDRAKFVDSMGRLDDQGLRNLYRVTSAIAAGAFPHSAAEIKAWTPAQLHAVIDKLPQQA